jgi:hypothetical protein
MPSSLITYNTNINVRKIFSYVHFHNLVTLNTSWFFKYSGSIFVCMCVYVFSKRELYSQILLKFVIMSFLIFRTVIVYHFYFSFHF